MCIPFRIFVSSTCFDLIDVRAEVAQLIRGLGMEPVLSDQTVSEFVVASDRNSIETCLANVRSSDVVLVILSQRYGPTLEAFGYPGVSATHLEYREAVAAGKPVHFYVRDRLDGEFGVWNRNRSRKGDDAGAPVVANFSWVSNKRDEALFSCMEERRAHRSGNNWYWPFKDSCELKQRIRRDLGGRAEQAAVARALSVDVAMLLRDAVEGLTRGRAGIALQTREGSDLEQWRGQILYGLRAHYKARAEDASVTWLRPAGAAKRRLHFYRAEGPVHSDHYAYAPGEGLAGTVWQTGVAGMHTPDRPHPSWLLRKGCENATYACAPVGPFTDSGGVLGVGSDTGFDLGDADLELLRVIGAVLELGSHGEVIRSPLDAPPANAAG